MKDKYDIYSPDWRPEKRRGKGGGQATPAELLRANAWKILLATVFSFVAIAALVGFFAMLAQIGDNAIRKSPRGLYSEGSRLALQGQHDEAIDYFTRGLAANPHPSLRDRFYLARGGCHGRFG